MVDLGVGSSLEPPREFLKNTDACVPLLEILIQLVWGVAWHGGEGVLSGSQTVVPGPQLSVTSELAPSQTYSIRGLGSKAQQNKSSG